MFAQKAVEEIISKDDFLAGAKEIEIIIDGKKYKATAKAFNTGSYGWNTNGNLKSILFTIRPDLQMCS